MRQRSARRGVGERQAHGSHRRDRAAQSHPAERGAGDVLVGHAQEDAGRQGAQHQTHLRGGVRAVSGRCCQQRF